MKIFFFSTVFPPSVGGIERMAELLCNEFTALGHQVRVATLTPSELPDTYPYPVIRRPRLGKFLELLRWCDVHVQANVSLKYVFARLILPGRMVYRHGSLYQRDDGTLRLVDRLKCFVAHNAPGIANSRYTAEKLGCSYTVLNAYDDAVFSDVTPWQERESDLVFVGRLVSQKGCDTLLRALGRLARQGITPGLAVVGDGPDRPALEALAASEGLAGQVQFHGILQGSALAALLNRHRFLVAPSRYEEPFGIVALEGLACGCVPVVSARGGLVDAIGGHGFTFPNGDDAALAETLATVLADPEAAHARLEGCETHLAACTARAVATRYIAVFEELLAKRR